MLVQFTIFLFLFIEKHDEMLFGLDLYAQLFRKHFDFSLLPFDFALEVCDSLCQLELLDVTRFAIGTWRVCDDFFEHLSYDIVGFMITHNDHIIFQS